MTALLAGLALGLASSAHCAAMCGPLVLGVARLAGRSRSAQLRFALLHHAGRVLVYVLLAVPAGLAGLAGAALTLHGFGRAMAIAAGVVLLLAAAGSIRAGGVARAGAALSAAVTRLSAPLLRWAARRPLLGPLATGALNGVLPCGLIYAALAISAASGTTVNAATVMAGFGIGTAAVLIAMTMAAASLPMSVRTRLRPLTPLVLVLAGCLLIGRGVSPSHTHAVSSGVSAHSHH